MKRLVIAAVALLTSPLLAETVGKIDFQLPPSNYEWKALISSNNPVLIKAIEEDGELDTDGTQTDGSLFVHREGDALEVFVATDYTVVPDEEDMRNPKVSVAKWLFNNGDHTKTPQEVVQGELNGIGFFFENYKFHVTEITASSDDELFFGWDFCDGQNDLVHGYCRAFRTTGGFAVLHYATTAAETQQNLDTWGKVLTQATRD